MITDKKNVYMVQVDLSYGNDERSVYLPYAVGLLVAYALEDESVKDSYSFERFIFTRENIESAVESLDNPYLVGFSTYVWSNEYNKLFAEKLKERFPDCIIVFGGHNVPPDTSFLIDHPYIDFLVHGEGEETFKNLLITLNNGTSFYEILNLSFRDKNELPVSTQIVPITSLLENYPSPYLSGIFDELIEQHKNFSFSAILETSRDCPFGCAFCDWGQLNSKVRRFSSKRVREEIKWLANHKVDYIWGADPNFGTFDDDFTIAEWLVEEKKKTGYPQILNVNYSKVRYKNVFRINKLLNDAKMSRGVPLSFQSLSPVVLKNISRENMDLEHFSKLIALYNESKVPMYSELIIGLPGETYDSFCRGIGILFEAGQHKTLNVYNYELLCNSKLGTPESVEKHKIETVQIPLIRFHCEPSEAYVQEYSKIVVSTYSMNRAMWKRSSLFSTSVQSFHNLGLLRCFAIYLYNEKGIKYESFYQKLQQWIESNGDSVCGHIYNKLSVCYDNVLAGKGGLYYLNPVFGNIVWSYTEALLLESLLNFEKFFSELESFLKTFNVEKDIYNDLLKYQKCTLKLPNVHTSSVHLNYDFHSYFRNVYLNDYKLLERKPNITHTLDNEFLSNWVDYARENVWYGHNDNRNIATNITVEYI